jgi:hypothetical protein
MEFDREKGIQAIITLQLIAGIDEPRERAEKAWDEFSDFDKENTMVAHSIFFGEKNIKSTMKR